MNYALPHDVLEQQAPFLFIDQVIEKEVNKIRCIKNLSYNEPYFQGHFPGNPILPGVLMIEMAAQASMLLMIDFDKKEKTRGYLVKINNVSYFKMAKPGDRLEVVVDMKENMGNYYTTKFCIKNFDNKAKTSKGELVFFLPDMV